MFVRGTLARAGMGRVGEYVKRGWKEDDWLYGAMHAGSASASLIPGVSNATAGAVAGGVGLLAAAVAAYFMMKK